MKIGELARLSGLTASRIRFYEASGLLQAVERQANGYRSYPAEALMILEIIASAQAAGFSLDEIRALLPTDLSAWAHDDLIQALQRKVKEIEALESRLRSSRANLTALIADIQNKPEGLSCTDNARRVLDRVRGGMMALDELTSND